MRHSDVTDNKAQKEDILKTFIRIIKYLWPHGRKDLKIRLLVSFLFIFIFKAISATLPWIYRDIVNKLSNPQNIVFWAIGILVIAYMITRIMAALFDEGKDILFAPVGQNALRTMSLEGFSHLHKLSMAFHIERRTGGVSRAIERAARGMQSVFEFGFWTALPAPVELIIISTLVWIAMGWQYTAVLLATVAIYAVVTLTITEWRTQFRKDMVEADTEAHSKAVDSLLNFETVRSFANEEWESKRFDEGLKKYEKAAVKSEVSLAYLNLIQTFILALSLLILMMMATKDVAAGKKNVGDFVLIVTYVFELWRPLQFLGTTIRVIRTGIVDVDNLFKLMDIEPDIQDTPNAQPLALTKANIAFNDISFAYDERRPILKNVSFSIPSGETLAIVGPSGSGKSTLSRLLFRYYDPSDGHIIIDGQNINQVTQASLRQSIGIVPQDTVLFNEDIYYNIAYGRPNATKEEIIAAAKAASIYDFIQSLPDGFQTTVGERGLKLSGGEKQRVGIARAILKQPQIMIFDEATSALDTHTEQDIQKALDKISQNRTTLIIAHRLSTVINADNIIVLEAGEIREQGNHNQLLEKGGIYATMWQKQQEARDAAEKLMDMEKDFWP